MVPKDKVANLIAKYDDLEKELSSGKIDPKNFVKKSKDYSEIGSIIKIAREYIDFGKQEKDLKIIINDKNNDEEIVSMAKIELEQLSNKRELYSNKLKIFLLPKDMDDKKNAIVEIRAGTGGLEATLFCSDLFRMYERVCYKKKMEN